MILLLSLLTLVLTIAAVPGLTRMLGRNAGWVVALIDLGLAIVLASLAPTLLRGNPASTELSWIPDWNVALSLQLDSLSWFFAEIALVIGAIVMVYSTRYFEPTDEDGNPVRHTSFFVLMTTFTFSMVLLVMANDLILMFVGWELTSLMSFMLIGRSGHAGEAGSLRTLFLTFTGGLFFLAALVVVIASTGTTNLTLALASDVWVTNSGLTTTVAVLVAIGAFTKAAQFPFHLWLPEAMAAETPVSAYLHAATVVKAGIYVLLRFSPIFRLNLTWQIILVVVGMFTAIMGALFALQKTDLKKLLAYSTVSQLGWIITTIGIGTHAALTAAVLHTFAHALFKSGLFMSVGCIQHATGTRDIRRLPPMWKYRPGLFLVVIIGALGMAGIPPTLGFVSKESMLHTFLTGWGGNAWAHVLTGFAVIGAALTVAYCFRIIFGGFIDGDRTVVTGEEAENLEEHDYEIKLHDVSPIMTWAAAIPAFLGMPLYFVVGFLGDPMSKIARDAVGPHTAMARWATSQYGNQLQTTELHMMDVGPVLGLSAIAIVAGILLTVFRRQVDKALDRELLPRDGAENLESLWNGMRSFGSGVDSLTRSDSPTRHIGALVVCLGLLAAGVTAAHLGGNITFDPRAENLDRPIDLLVLAVVVIASLGAVTTRSRMAAVVLLSAAGTGVTLQIFALGAPDVGITQLLVEILTTVMYMLALRRLPRGFRKPGRGRHISALVIAIFSGLAAFGGVMVFTGRRGRSELADYFLTNGPEITHGTNVTNTILVEFRAMDTYGEMAVLGVTGIAIAAVLLSVARQYRRTGSAPFQVTRKEVENRLHAFGRVPLPTSYAYRDTITNTFPLRLFLKALVPVMMVIALVIFWRGHNAPGGGFIGGLLVAVALALIWLSMPVDRPISRRVVPSLLVAVGLTLATFTGILGFLSDTDHSLGAGVNPHSFLSGLHWDIPVLGTVPSAVFFDFGITLCVLGMVLTALNQLGASQDPFGSSTPEQWPPYDPLRSDPREEGPVDNPHARHIATSYHSPIAHKDMVKKVKYRATKASATKKEGDDK